jgi:hypothetical protein
LGGAGGNQDHNDQLKQLELIKQKMVKSNFAGGTSLTDPRQASEENQALTNRTKEQQMAFEILGYAPELTESSEEEDEYESSSEGDPDAAINYKNEAYWALPENVRQAIDTAKKKSKHSDFYNRLRSLNDKIGVYKKIFYTKTPKYE